NQTVAPHTHHPPSPTRRSSDLPGSPHRTRIPAPNHWDPQNKKSRNNFSAQRKKSRIFEECEATDATDRRYWTLAVLVLLVITLRSEEHTSELQSRFDLVCRLLL